MSVQDYYATLMGFFYDLTRLKPPHGCECGKCDCNVATKYELDREEEKLHQFLIRIDDDKYAIVRTNLLSQQPPPDLERAYQALVQEERSRTIAQEKIKPDYAHIFALPTERRPSLPPSRVEKSRLYCSHCKRSGHDNAGCFILHGYPSWWIEKYGKRGASSSGQQHTSLPHQGPSVPTQQTAPGAPLARAHAVAGTVGDSPSSATLSALSELQPEHVRILLNMVTNRQSDHMGGESLSLYWIIDTGASHHVTGDESCLSDVRMISPCPVGMPDGTHAVATKEGCVMLANDITLKHVLFDQHSGSLIGGGERIDGLYYFRTVPKVCAVSDQGGSAFELWHRRMGHPSDRIVKLVPAISTIVDDFSRGVWVYLINNKTEVYSSFCSFFAMIERQFNAHVRTVRSDNGTEFKPLLPYFNTNGIIFQTSCVGTPQQNGRVERKHQHILNVSRALMFQGNLPITLWGECVLGAVYLINRTPS
ncbi:hypothetical protein RND81_06G227800 [Saponaria officinalis]|uniref:Integrase catalytic domain-containing protein n=1 Tax=Saponaria officinalis TaxID=3572 RepID=A0AAW1KEW9_SAPOF